MSDALVTVNPATGETLATYRRNSAEEVGQAAREARDAFLKWGALSVDERAAYLPKLARVLRARKGEFAELMTLEMGKPIAQSEAEVAKCAWAAEFYAEFAAGWLSDEKAATDAKEAYVTFEPLGTVLSVMPWNFPFWQALRFAIPTLTAGNTSILKHASMCTGSSLAIESAFSEAGYPAGCFRSIIADHQTVMSLIESPLIQGVSLTGSEGAGAEVGKAAGGNFKKLVLELGGSDPFIVLSDADVEKAAVTAAEARLINSGQSCIAAKRFIVDSAVAAEFTEQMTRIFEKKRTGDPLDRSVDVGPLAGISQRDGVGVQVKDALDKGATATVGAAARGGPGAFYEPTVLKDVNPQMKVMHEEVFGPVAPVYPVNGDDEAIRLANDSKYGLGASLWTGNREKAKRYARRIESGMVFVNALVKSDPRIPFGGVKNSGLGRELSIFGLREFVNVKPVSLY